MKDHWRSVLLRAFIGSPPVENHETVTADHVVQTFQVTIRALNSVHPGTLKDLIERRYEVMECRHLEGTAFVR